MTAEQPPIEIRVGDCLESLRAMPNESIHCCVTSPPYFGLRDYGVAGQMGLEPTPAEFVANMVLVFEEVRRVLRKDGTLWLNLGDSYAGSWGAQSREHAGKHAPNISAIHANQVRAAQIRESGTENLSRTPGLKNKDLIGIPWRVAFALQEAGWWLRQDIIWAKPNPMPESTRDRPTRSHEYIFLLSKSAKYYYDCDAIKEPCSEGSIKRISQPNFANQTGGPKDYGPNSNRSMRKTLENFAAKVDKQRGHGRRHDGFNDRWDKMEKSEQCSGMRNKRDVWVVGTAPYRGAHFATFPPKLILPCILAGCPAGGTVLDPFGGSGTTGMVAAQNGRGAILLELNPAYAELARIRCGLQSA